MTVADLKLGASDPMGDKVVLIHGIKPPEYAVYSTARRLLVWFADAPAINAEQRKGLAPLGPVRGEINGLVDGWRSSWLPSRKSKVSRYDRRVADALLVALEHDVDGAKIILGRIKQDILDERAGFARLEYLLCALAISMVCILGVSWLTGGIAADLWRAAAAGALGAFFSLAVGIRRRTVLPDLSWVANVTDASLRVLIGFIGASILMALLAAKMIVVSLGSSVLDGPDQATAWLFPLIIGFVAGFSERLVPDLLSRAEAASPPLPRAQGLPAADAGKAAAAATAAAASSGSRLGQGAAGRGVPDGSVPPLEAAAQGLVPGGLAPHNAAVHEADFDHCICSLEIAPAEVSRDDELPAASGGIASASQGQRL